MAPSTHNSWYRWKSKLYKDYVGLSKQNVDLYKRIIIIESPMRFKSCKENFVSGL